MKNCPFCGEEVQDAAVKCKHCKEWLSNKTETNKGEDTSSSQPPLTQPREEQIGYSKNSQAPRPWVRFWARTFDINIFLYISCFLLGVLYALIKGEPLSPPYVLLLLILGFLSAFVIDAIFMAFFGNTPGKAILRTYVTNADGSRLSFQDALERNIDVLISGYGLGLPLVQLVTFIVAYNKLTNKGKTSWDEKNNFIVSHRHIGGGRILIFCLVYFVLLCFAAFLNIITK